MKLFCHLPSLKLFYIFLSALALIETTGCKKESSKTPTDDKTFVETIDRLNYVIINNDTIYHINTQQNSFQTTWDFKFKIRYTSWWNNTTKKYCYFSFSSASGVLGHFDVTLQNDSIEIIGKNQAVPITWGRDPLINKEIFRFNNIKMFENYPDTSKYFLMSGQCTN